MPLSRDELIEQYGEPDEYADVAGCNNLDRVEFAWTALAAFLALHHGGGYDRADLEDAATGCASEAIGDLICDLMHFATAYGSDPDEVVDRGRRHFVREVGLGYEAP